MSDDLARGVLEHEHHAHELLERGKDDAMRLVPLLAAILAVLAGLCGLYGGRLAERILTFKNEAVLHEVTASDLWAQYQAESLKAHIYGVGAMQVDPKRAVALRAMAARFRTEQAPLRRQATSNEVERDQALSAAAAGEQRKLRLDVAVALFEISIVLTSVAALTHKPWLVALAGAGGIAGVAYGALGMLASA